jgi:glycosyltransferase involved in cell wall biosynthesis
MKSKMNILWISLNAPTKKSGKAGSNSFSYYFRNFYFDERFKVKIISQIENDLDLIDLNEGDYFYLKRSKDLISKLNRLSSFESKFNPWNRNANLISNQMESYVKKCIAFLKHSDFIPNFVVLEWTHCVILSRVIRSEFPSALVIAVEHDVTFIGYERKAKFYKGVKKLYWNHLYKWEKKKELFALNICDFILPYNNGNKEILVREGIDEVKLYDIIPYYNNMMSIKRAKANHDILFYGAMSRAENYLSAEWFINNVMTLINDLDVRFIVLGSNPPKKLINMQNSRILVTGFVDNVEPFFENSMCFVAPLMLGAGIKVKILEALSSGIPVLTNKIGIEGIMAKNQEEYFHCETQEEFERIIRDIYNEKIDKTKVLNNAKSFIRRNFSYENSILNLKSLLIEFGS